MKRVIWVDDAGYAQASWIRDTDDEKHPEIGVPIQPPPIERIVMESAKEIQNEFVQRGILTYRDVVQSQNGVSQILNILRSKLIEAFKIKELEDDGSK